LAGALVLGIVAGGIYGLFALGIVLVYRGTGALNFAQGELGTAALYLAWWLVTDHGLPWIVGAVAAIAMAAVLGLAFERLVVRSMVQASRLSVAIATVGLLSLLLALEFRAFSASPRQLKGPIGGGGFELAGVVVSPTQVLSLVVVAVVGVGLAMFLRRTDFGLGVLAAAEDPVAVRLVGVPLSRVSAFVWATGAGLSALGALLIVPSIGVFSPGFANGLFLRGLAAAVVGGLTNLPGAFVGGLVVGIVEAGVADRFADSGLPGVKTLAIFGVILVVLLVRPQGLLTALRSRGAE
jgi:branched-chain amino acid transport system permease protein